MTETIFTLPDFRKLSYAVYGPSSGRPVLYFHGTPSSRLEPLILANFGVDLEALLHKANLKLIAIDRPGMGFSSYYAHVTYLSFAEDVWQLAQALHIGSCPVLCWSGGGPYALALAHHYPRWIQSVHIICGFTRKFDNDVLQQMGMNKWYFILARNFSPLLRSAMKVLRYHKARGTVPQKITGLPYEDYVFLTDPENLEMFSTLSMKQASRLGSKGPVAEARRYFREFEFDISGVQQPVHYWWGHRDQTVIKLHPEEVERKIPNHVMHYREGEGHLSIYIHCFPEVLQNISYHYQ